MRANGFKFKDNVTYDVSKYFYDSNYECYNLGSTDKVRFHIRRCKINYMVKDVVSPSCIFCPMNCAFCARPIEHYTYGSNPVKLWGASSVTDPIYKCHFHSLHAIEPRKIRARKGKTEAADVKCVIKDHCKSSPCQNLGTCVKTYYSYTCFCTKEYYGKNCEKNAGNLAGKLTYGVQLWFPLEVVAARIFPFFITVAHEGENQIIELTTPSKLLIRLRPSDKIQNFDTKCSGGKCRCDTKGNCKTAYKGILISDLYYLKANFFHLPMLFVDLFTLAMVTNVTIKVYNEKLNLNEPVYQETINSLARLRLQDVFFNGGVQPNSACQVISASGSIESRPSICVPDYALRPKVPHDVKSLFLFDPTIIEFGWQVFKKKGDTFPEVGDLFKQKRTGLCKSNLIKAHWRFYKVDGLYKMTDRVEESKKLEMPNVCTEKQVDNDFINNVCEPKFNKMGSGDYVLRLTIQSYKQSNDKIPKYRDNAPYNYYCYFTLLGKKQKDFKIKGNETINACMVNIDTTAVPNEGKMIWTCKVIEKGPCPPTVIVNDKTYLDNTKFVEGKYEICAIWEVENEQVGRKCVTVVCKEKNKSEHKPDLIVSCLENCLVTPDPNVPVRLRVIDRNTGQPPKTNITWEIRDPDGKTISLGDVIIPEGVKPYELKMNVTKLKKCVAYTVYAQDAAKDKIIPYNIEYCPHEMPTDGNCTMTPKSGMKGFTLFDITCFGWQSEGPILYEFFDKGSDDIEHYQVV
ncbi:uncharacterized protein LOC128993058 [Macrosteles quadrilineatus]|uniref:uncharacterized protein LOC128993058 n=1 Tax=Macrosteles quadrilineatus TaxID=74068 RepID=UPI0023E258BF|nr:uncharacterized protein LOC128993058 [Macrosteles quadrilineatus]